MYYHRFWPVAHGTQVLSALLNELSIQWSAGQAASGTARSLQSGVVPGGRPLDLLVSNNPFAAEKSRCAANTTVFCDIKQPMGQLHNTILAVFPDRQVARFRQEVLCDAGFEVFSVHTESAARYSRGVEGAAAPVAGCDHRKVPERRGRFSRNDRNPRLR